MDDIDTSALADATYTADVDDEDYVPPDDDQDNDQADDDNKDDKTDDSDDSDDDDQKDESDDQTDKLAELTNKLTEAQKEINRLGYALRKKDDTKEEKETPFTKEQLFQLYKEHKDSPEVVFQIFEEMSKQGKVDAQEAAERSIDIKNKKSETEKFIKDTWPDAVSEGTELYDGIQNAIKWAHLENHPFAQEAALGLLLLRNYPETIKQIEENAKKEAEKTNQKNLKDKNENARKASIKAGQSSKAGGSDDNKAASLSPDQMDTAKRLGIDKDPKKLARYAKIVAKKGETIHAEA